MNCKEFNQQDIVDYLLSLGLKPTKIQGSDYWYFSPFRNERTPSFKVNRKFNVWYDFGLCKGGKLIDFGIQYYKCSVNELLAKQDQQNRFPFQQHILQANNDHFKQAGERAKIAITDIRDNIKSLSLQQYLSDRKIPLSIANQFCQEVDFLLYDKKNTAIGFKNSAGGYELRSAHFKGSSSPKEVTFLKGEHSNSILVYEGFFDFLSYQAIHHRKLLLPTKRQPDFLILNSIGFIEKIKPKLEDYGSVHLYLDRDSKGISVTKELLALGNKYQDKSQIYKNHKDLNEYLISEHLEQRQSQRRGRRL